MLVTFLNFSNKVSTLLWQLYSAPQLVTAQSDFTRHMMIIRRDNWQDESCKTATPYTQNMRNCEFKNANLTNFFRIPYGNIWHDYVPFMNTRCKLIIDPTSSLWIINVSHGHPRNWTTVTSKRYVNKYHQQNEYGQECFSI